VAIVRTTDSGDDCHSLLRCACEVGISVDTCPQCGVGRPDPQRHDSPPDVRRHGKHAVGGARAAYAQRPRFGIGGRRPHAAGLTSNFNHECDLDASKLRFVEALRIAQQIDHRIAQYYSLAALGWHAASSARHDSGHSCSGRRKPSQRGPARSFTDRQSPCSPQPKSRRLQH
jgi:hypothetical protein